MVNLADALEKEGISAFRFDFSGNGYGFRTLYICQLFSLLFINHSNSLLNFHFISRFDLLT